VPSSKAESNRLYQLGYYGNKPKTWETWEDFWTDSTTPPYSLRTIHKPGVKLPYYCQPLESKEQVYALVELWMKVYEVPLAAVTYSGYTGDERVKIQMEVMRSEKNYSLRYSRVKKMLRLALAEESLHLEGLQALILLKTNLCEAAYSKLQELFDEFPDEIIELTVFDCAIGDLGWNTVIWEVRNY